MKYNILVVAFLLVGFASCKNNTEDKTAEEPLEKVDPSFNVDIDIINELDDAFALYYTEDNSINFTEEHAFWTDIQKGSPQVKTVNYKFPEEIIPTDIRLDFGNNKQQKSITLEKLKMSFQGKTFEAKGSDFLKYFIANDSIKTEIDEAKGSIKFLQNEKGFNPAFYYPNEALISEISKLTGNTTTGNK